ncbi:MAG: hypothetical protein RL217_1272 [Pseudomonadota bacterium]|jgi:hypothetical protein
MLKRLNDENSEVQISTPWLRLVFILEWLAISVLSLSALWLLNKALSL